MRHLGEIQAPKSMKLNPKTKDLLISLLVVLVIIAVAVLVVPSV